MTEFRWVYVTTPDLETARKISKRLLEERLCACTNIIPGMESHYHWQGRIESASETVLVLKTVDRHWEALKVRLQELHPAQVPCVLSLPVLAGHEGYLQWMTDNLTPHPPEAR